MRLPFREDGASAIPDGHTSDHAYDGHAQPHRKGGKEAMDPTLPGDSARLTDRYVTNHERPCPGHDIRRASPRNIRQRSNECADESGTKHYGKEPAHPTDSFLAVWLHGSSSGSSHASDPALVLR